MQVERSSSIYSGGAAVNSRRGVFCIDDPSQGVALYRLSSRARIRTYAVPVTKSMRPRQVTFAEDCSAIVSGSDHGVVYILDRRSGDIVDELRMDPDSNSEFSKFIPFCELIEEGYRR